MNKQTKILILIFSVLFAGILLSILYWNNSENPINSKSIKSSNWIDKYQIDSKDPYGLFLFFKLIKNKNPNQKIEIISSSKQFDSIVKLEDNATFIMIGDTLGLMPEEAKLLNVKLLNGSSLFASASFFDKQLFDYFDLELKTEFFYENEVNFYFNKSNFNCYSIYQNDTIYSEWYGFSSFNTEGLFMPSSLIKLNTLHNLLKIELPFNSQLFIHSTPISLTNISARSKNAFNYLSFIVNQLPQNQRIYYLEIASVTNKGEKDEIEAENNLLKLITENRVLLNSMMLIIFCSILFVVFRSKRRRAKVQFVERELNYTKSYAETIASIYLNKKNPTFLLNLQKKNFYDTILRFYYIDLYKNQDDETLKRLAEKTNYKLDELISIIRFLSVDGTQVSDEYIVKVAKKQHDFYNHCGIIEEKISRSFKAFELGRNFWITTCFLLTGIVLFLYGLVMLSGSNAAGVILWILGVIFTFLSILRFIKPHLIVNEELITFHYLFRKSTEIRLEELLKINFKNEKIIFITSKQIFTISKFDTFHIDVVKLKKFIHLNKLYDN